MKADECTRNLTNEILTCKEADGVTVWRLADDAGLTPIDCTYDSAAKTYANAEGLISGTDSSMLNPTGDATRAQIAVILQRLSE